MYPRYLAEVRGYSALMIGETMFVSGITMFLTAPIVGRLMQKVDMRLIIATGLVIFALGSWQMTWITRDYDFYELLVPQILRGIGMMFAMVPTNTIALGTLPPDRVKNASGLFNLTRNLGGAVGLALINQVLNDRTDLHISRLQDRVTWGNTTATETLNMFTQRLQGMGDASLMAMKQLSQIVHRQAVVMGYGDAFFILTLFYFGLSLMVMLLKKPAAMTSGARRIERCRYCLPRRFMLERRHDARPFHLQPRTAAARAGGFRAMDRRRAGADGFAAWLVVLAGLLAIAGRVHDDVPALLAVKLPLLQSRPELIFAGESRTVYQVDPASCRATDGQAGGQRGQHRL